MSCSANKWQVISRMDDVKREKSLKRKGKAAKVNDGEVGGGEVFGRKGEKVDGECDASEEKVTKKGKAAVKKMVGADEGQECDMNVVKRRGKAMKKEGDEGGPKKESIVGGKCEEVAQPEGDGAKAGAKKRGRPPKKEVPMDEKDDENVVVKKRGRPPKKKAEEVDEPVHDALPDADPAPKKRGRPPKKDVIVDQQRDEQNEKVSDEAVLKKKRGRPAKKTAMPDDPGNDAPPDPAPKKRGRPPTKEMVPDDDQKVSDENVVVKKRGRPPKKKVEEVDEPVQDALPDVDPAPKKRGRPPKKTAMSDDGGDATEQHSKAAPQKRGRASKKQIVAMTDQEHANSDEGPRVCKSRTSRNKKATDRDEIDGDSQDDPLAAKKKGGKAPEIHDAAEPGTENPAPKKRGRPPKKKAESAEPAAEQAGLIPEEHGQKKSLEHDGDEDISPKEQALYGDEERNEQNAPKKRGRPPKKATPIEDGETKQPKKRGRPPKMVAESRDPDSEQTQGSKAKPRRLSEPGKSPEPLDKRDQNVPKKRGRPAKSTNKAPPPEAEKTKGDTANAPELDQHSPLEANEVKSAAPKGKKSGKNNKMNNKDSQEDGMGTNIDEASVTTVPIKPEPGSTTPEAAEGKEKATPGDPQPESERRYLEDSAIVGFDVGLEPENPPKRLNFYALNVGLGNLLICTIGMKAIIFDAGSLDVPMFPKFGAPIWPFVNPAIEILKGKEIVAVVITHPHEDHCNLILPVLQKSGHRVSQVQFICGGFKNQLKNIALKMHIPQSAIFSIDPEKTDSEEHPFVRDQTFVDNMKAKIEQILNDGFADVGATFEVFLPRKVSCDVKASENIHVAGMIMFKIKYLERTIFISGDAMPETVANLTPDEKKPTKSVLGDFDIYMVPHHGSYPNGRNGVLGKAVPKLLICSVDASKKKSWENGLPRQRTMDRLAEDIPEVAPEHTVLVWDQYHPSSQFSYVEATPPFELRTKMPFYTTSKSFFPYRDRVFEGIHVFIDPADGKEKGDAFLELLEDDVLHHFSIDDFHDVRSPKKSS